MDRKRPSPQGHIRYNFLLVGLLITLSFLGLGSHTRQITLQTKDNIKIEATYYPPKEKQAPGVILLHMLSRDRHDWNALAKRLQEEGYGCLSLDFRGHGESLGPAKKPLNWRDFTQKDYARMVLDLKAGWSFLSHEPQIIRDRIAIIGASIGANIALVFAARNPRVKSLVLLSPGLNYRGIETPEAIRNYGPRPIFIVASKEDIYAADSSAKLYALSRGKAVLKLYEGSGHGTKLLNQDKELPDLIINWVKDTL
jgi:pimeloyl-ACP methyl ester carboxylesterase